MTKPGSYIVLIGTTGYEVSVFLLAVFIPFERVVFTVGNEGTAMKSGLSTSLKSFFIISPCYQVQHGGYN